MVLEVRSVARHVEEVSGTHLELVSHEGVRVGPVSDHGRVRCTHVAVCGQEQDQHYCILAGRVRYLYSASYLPKFFFFSIPRIVKVFSGPDDLMQSILKVVDQWKEDGLEIFSKKEDGDLLEKLKRLQLMRLVPSVDM